MTRRKLRDEPRFLLWGWVVAATGIIIARLNSDPDGPFGGPVVHFVVLGVGGAGLVAAVVGLVLQSIDRRDKRQE